MTLAPKIAVGFAGFALLAGGAAVWAKYGSLVYFDTIAFTLAGCFL